MANPYIGSKISLISKAGIRYEGTLYTIDTEQSTVALSKVKSYGTESRAAQRYVPPRDEIFEYIIFRGSDIQDLTVSEGPQADPYQDPAIVESSSAPPPPTNQVQDSSFQPPTNQRTAQPHAQIQRPVPGSAPVSQLEPKQLDPVGTRLKQLSPSDDANSTAKELTAPKQSNASKPSPAQAPTAVTELDPTNKDRREQPPQHAQQHTQQQQHRPNPNQNRRQGGGDYTRQHSGGNRPYRGQRGRGGQRNSLKFETDFDFDKMNEQFSKDDITKELKDKLNLNSTPTPIPDGGDGSAVSDKQIADHSDDEDDEKCYDKTKSFFDSLSSETTDRAAGRLDRQHERVLNTETFGQAFPRGGYRRGYRGGRGGGYRGGYRGGYGGYGGYSNNRGGYRGNYNGRGHSGYRGRGNYSGGYQQNRSYNNSQGESYNNSSRGNRGGGPSHNSQSTTRNQTVSAQS